MATTKSRPPNVSNCRLKEIEEGPAGVKWELGDVHFSLCSGAGIHWPKKNEKWK